VLNRDSKATPKDDGNELIYYATVEMKVLFSFTFRASKLAKVFEMLN